MLITRSKKEQFIDTFGWGCVLWVVGFALGMMAFPFLEPERIGLVVVPILSLITITVAYQRFNKSGQPRAYYYIVGLIWALYPVVLDYLFIVRAFAVGNYYDADVFAYYLITFAVPIIIGEKFGKEDIHS